MTPGPSAASIYWSSQYENKFPHGSMNPKMYLHKDDHVACVSAQIVNNFNEAKTLKTNLNSWKD